MTITPAALSALVSGDLDNFMVAATPGGIEAQEARGQSDLCSKSRLPKDHRPECRKALEDAGVVFGDSADDLFVNVTLPEGWKLQPTEHSMWSDLLDASGCKRAAIFYKAAFYDMSAHFNACRRFCVSGYHDIQDDDSRSIVVLDAKQDEPVKTFGRVESGKNGWEAGDALESQAIGWLKEHYPDYNNAAAYWAD